MMVAAHPIYTSVDEYLRLEEKSQTKHEYIGGKIVAMAGATPEHNLILVNAITELRTQLRKRGCLVFPSDQKVRMPSGLFAYPDISIVCGKPQYDDKHPDILLNPLVVVEVLSPTTERYDRVLKFAHYRSLQSLQEYVLIAQDAFYIGRYTRQENGEWLYDDAIGREAELKLRAIDITLVLSVIYEDVDVPDEDMPPDA